MSFRYGWRDRSRLPVLVLLLLGAACGKGDPSRPVVIANNPPVVTSVAFNRPRAHAAEDLVVAAGAADADNDPLIFRWSATRGDFPLGIGLRSVTWRSPKTRGTDTLTVLVTDREDTVRYRVAVTLVLPEPPGALTAENQANLADLHWAKSPDEGIEAWAGYEVYGADRSLAALPEAELLPYLLTPEPITQRSYRAFGLVPGQKYFYHVRALRKYDDVIERSVFVQEVDLSPRPDGYQSGFGELTSAYGIAFDLSGRRARLLDPATTDPAAVQERDFYLGTTDPFDVGGPLALKSVSLLANRSAAWAAREMLIKPLAFDWGVSTVTDDGWATSALVESQRVYAVKTPEGNFAKLRVTAVVGFEPNRSISLQWAYQTIPGYAISSDPPWVVPFVKAIVLRFDRRSFLLQHRIKPGDLYEGFWELPGGRVQVGESMHDCLKREVQEETGLSITEILGQRSERIVDRLGGTARLVRPVVTVEVEEHAIFGHYFACVAEPDADPRASAEGDRHHWITPDAFRQAFLVRAEQGAPIRSVSDLAEEQSNGDEAELPVGAECSTVDLLALRVAFADGLDRFFQP